MLINKVRSLRDTYTKRFCKIKNPVKMSSDWDTVTVLKKRMPKASAMKSEKAVNAARRQGMPVDTQQKCKLTTVLDSSTVTLCSSRRGCGK